MTKDSFFDTKYFMKPAKLDPWKAAIEEMEAMKYGYWSYDNRRIVDECISILRKHIPKKKMGKLQTAGQKKR